MKLAVIRRQFSATGGAELYLQRLMTALVDAGHEVHLFAEAWSGQAKDVKLHPVPVTGTRATRPVRFAEAVKELTSREPFDCVFSLERTLKQDVYRAGDGVHRVWLERRRQFAPWWKKPFIGMGAFHRNMMALEKQTFDPANTRRIIVNSNMVKGEILRHFQFPEERIHLVRNGVDVKRLQSGKRAETRARFGVKDDEFLLLFVGSGWERKGLKYVVKTMDQLKLVKKVMTVKTVSKGRSDSLELTKSIKLLVAGTSRAPGPTRPDIIYAGSVTDVENAYAASDLLFMLPTYEPGANVVVEALAAGLPVVTSANNGASEVIENGVNGSVVADPRDTDQCTSAVMFWLGSSGGERDAAKDCFDLNTNVSQTVEILEHSAKELRS